MLLPGLDGTGRFFAPLLRALPKSLNVIVIAYPHVPDMNYRALSDYAASQLPDGPFVVLGESFSGPVATLLAKRFPQRSLGLILASSFVSAPIPRMLSPVLALPGLVPAARTFARFALLGLNRDAELAALLATVIPSLPVSLIRFRASLILQSDCTRDFCAVMCPILVLHGTRDALVSRNYVKKLQRLRPDAKICSLEGPHMLLQINPNECAAEISRFAASCRISAP